MSAQYLFRTSVLRVFERTHCVGATPRDAEGKSYPIMESAGWYVTILDGTAIHIGMEKPLVKVGDEVEIIIRAKEVQNGETR